MDIGDWLTRLGFSQYEAAFRENAIDADVLRELTDEHLRDLGVPLGHRLKMLRSIRELTGTSVGSRPVDVPRATDAAERRQLTVVFCDLVGSTEMAARMDPEDLREVIGVYHRRVAKTVQRFGGFVAKYMGDGVLMYFGYPQANENDAELAVRTGLKLVTKVAELRPHPDVALQVRVGIASGLVVVGDLLGAGASQEQAVVGDTPNLAARLQSIAEPGSVLIAESTHRLVSSLFDYRELGPVPVKGFAGPVPVWQVVGASAYTSRFEALHTGPLTPLVGRGRGNRPAAAPLEPGEGRSRPRRAGVRRARHRQVAHRRKRWSDAWPRSRIRGCAISVRRIIATARSIRSSASSSMLRASIARTRPPPNATSFARCFPCPRQQRSDELLIAELLSLPTDGLPSVEAAPAEAQAAPPAGPASPGRIADPSGASPDGVRRSPVDRRHVAGAAVAQSSSARARCG